MKTLHWGAFRSTELRCSLQRSIRARTNGVQGRLQWKAISWSLQRGDQLVSMMRIVSAEAACCRRDRPVEEHPHASDESVIHFHSFDFRSLRIHTRLRSPSKKPHTPHRMRMSISLSEWTCSPASNRWAHTRRCPFDAAFPRVNRTECRLSMPFD